MKKQILNISIVVLFGLLFAFSGCEIINPEKDTDDPAETYTLSVSIEGQGSVDKSPNKSEYEDGEVVTLTASPSSGWVFSNWSGAVNSTSKQTDITIDSDKSVTATFEEIYYDITSESTYSAQSSSYDSSFVLNYTLKNSGNTTITLNSGVYEIYSSAGYVITDIVKTRDTMSFPKTLPPGETVSAVLEGYSQSYVIPYSFGLAFSYNDEFGNSNSEVMGGQFDVQ